MKISRVYNEKGPFMNDKNPTKTIEFREKDEEFVKQLAKDIGCHYSKANGRTFNLNKFDSSVNGEMGIFAWVHKAEDNLFWVSTRKIWVKKAMAKQLNIKNQPGMNCFPRDIMQAEDSVCLTTKDDYPKTIQVLSLINEGL